MTKSLSPVYCPNCGTLLFRSISFIGSIEIVCGTCHETINWSLSSNLINIKKSLKNALVINEPQIAFAIFKEISLWRDLVKRKMKKNESIIFVFEHKYLPEAVAETISAGLNNVNNLEDVDLVFWEGIEYFLGKQESTS